MIKKDLYVLIGISIGIAIFFLVANANCFITSLDGFIANMGAIGLFIIPTTIGIIKYKKEVIVNV